MKPETQFRQLVVIPFLKTLTNTVFFPIQQVAIVGDPDFMLCIRGRFVALELKSENGTLSPLQRHKLECICKKGGVALVVSPATWEHVKNILKRLNEWGEQ